MKISFAPYKLMPISALNTRSQCKARQGALLRFDFAPGLTGYSDCHPWVCFGDLPLKEQLDKLGKGQRTPLTRQSEFFALQDAEARKKGESLFKHAQIPQSHAICLSARDLTAQKMSDLSAEGFHHVKVKVSAHWQKDLKYLRENISSTATKLKLRLDFNALLAATDELIPKARAELEPLLTMIDFIEDPFRYSFAQWRKLNQCLGNILAIDHELKHLKESEELLANFLIYKPAVQDELFIKKCAQTSGAKIVVTSYMDHPLGQMSAAWCAAKDKNEIYGAGLLTHFVYETNQYSEMIIADGSYLKAPKGTGFGFDELLEREKWQLLR